MSSSALAVMETQTRHADVDLAQALVRGEEAVYAELMDAYYGGMRRLASSYLHDPDSIEDVIQDTWITVVKCVDSFEGRSSLKTWIFGILLNIARRRASREHRFVTLDEDVVDEKRGAGQNPDDWVAGQQLLSHVESAISTLPHTQRCVVTLRDVEGWSAEEVCDLLEISPANQRVLLHRARLRLRESLRTLHYFGKP